MKLNRRSALRGIVAAITSLVVSPLVSLAKAATGWKDTGCSSRSVHTSGRWAFNCSQRTSKRGDMYLAHPPVFTLLHRGVLWAQFTADLSQEALSLGLLGPGPERDTLCDLVAKSMVGDKDQLLNYWRPGYVRYLRHMFMTDPLAEQIVRTLAEYDGDFARCCEHGSFTNWVYNMIRRRRPDPAEVTLGHPTTEACTSCVACGTPVEQEKNLALEHYADRRELRAIIFMRLADYQRCTPQQMCETARLVSLQIFGLPEAQHRQEIAKLNPAMRCMVRAHLANWRSLA